MTHRHMGDPNMSKTMKRLDSPAKSSDKSLTPPSLNHAAGDAFRSNTSSPLLDTEPFPMDDPKKCPYCHKNFRKPRVLDCLHSMCEDCIIAQLDGRREQKNDRLRDPTDCELEAPKVTERPTPPGVIRCPICAQESHVGNDVRYVHSMLLDYVRLAECDEIVQGDRRCRACKSEQPAVAFCKQCQSDLCSSCLSAHSVMRMFDSHVVTTYEELEKNGFQHDVRPVLCPIHSQTFKMLCATCETMACKQCLEMEHINHKVIEVTEPVILAIQNEIRGLADRVDQKWRNSLSEWSVIPDRSAALHEQYEIVKLRLDSTFDELAKALEDVKTRKFAELEEARLRQEQNIEELYRKMNLNEARVGDAITFSQRLLDHFNGMELVASRRKVIQQLNNLSHTMPALGIQFVLEYQPISRKQMDAHLNNLAGIIQARTVAPPAKESATNGSEVSSTRASQDGGNDWGRGTPTISGGTIGGGIALGAIGNERKKNANLNGNSGARTASAGGEPFGWPPSSNPPDLPPPSPPTSGLLPAPGPPGPPGAPIREMSLPDLTASNNNMSLPLNQVSAASILPNYAWPNTTTAAAASLANVADIRSLAAQFAGANSQNLPSAQQQLAAAQQLKLAQALLFPNSGSNNILGANQALLMQAQAQARGLRGVDPLLMAGLGNLNLGAAAAVAAAANPSNNSNNDSILGVGGTPMSQRVSDLRVHSVFGTSQQGSSIRELHCPSGFCLSETDDILIADTNNHRVVVCGPPHPWKIGRPGTDDGQLCFPRKVVSLRGDSPRYVVLDKGVDGKTRAQIFDVRGEFLKRINMSVVTMLPRGGIEVSAATAAPNGQLLLVDTSGLVYCIEVDTPRVTYCFDASQQLGEASDVAMNDKYIYITDFKHHCVQVFSTDGTFVRKMGEPSQTPYPIGIDVSKSGEILVADTHGNHLHVVVFSPEGVHQQSFTHNEFRLSRCVGLRIAKSGHIVTLCKHNHTLFVFKPLFLR